MGKEKIYGKVAVIVLNWNGGAYIVECIESLQKLTYPNYEIIIVDNASIDGSPQLIKEKYPDVTLIQNETNLGFAEGNNVGIRYALGKGAGYIFLLNNDTIVDEGILGHLVGVAESDSTIGILGPKIYYYERPNEIWFAGGLIDWKTGLSIHIGKNYLDEGQFDEVKAVDYITGCALFVKAEVCQRVGLMDPRFFLYYEETDWCARTKRAGYKIVFVPQAKVWHRISVTTGGKKSALGYYYYARNKLLLAKNHLHGARQLRFIFFFGYDFLWRESWSIIRSNKAHKGKKLKALWAGVYHYLLGRFGEGPKWLTEKSHKNAEANL